MTDQRPLVLLVDDDHATLATLQDELEGGGFNVDPATTHEEAARKVEQRVPDLVLLNILAERESLRFLTELQSTARTCKVPVLLLANVGDEALIEEARAAGAAGYALKTRETPRDILRRVHELLAARRQ